MGNSPTEAYAVSFLRFIDHTHTHPVWLLQTSDQLVAEAASYITYNKHNRRKFMPSAGFEPAVSVVKRL